MKLETAKRWLILFYEKIQENLAVLAELDSTMGGDGDHGENMLRGMTAVVNTVEPKEFASTSDLFKETGMLLLTKVGGVSGTLYDSAFLGMARAEEAGDSLYHDIKEGLVMIQRRGRAEIGDKTMVDVWAPVVEDLKNHQLTPERIDEYILKTALLRAKKGRHAYAADGSLGLVDPGSYSSGLLFKALLEAEENDYV